MKLLCAGDLHIRAKKPRSRTDGFFEAQYKKIEYLLLHALDNGIHALAFPGDIFDRHDTPYWVIEKYIHLFQQATNITPLRIFVIAGQHDQRYHTADLHNTPLGILLAACANTVKLVGTDPICFCGVAFYGASWGKEIPELKPDMYTERVSRSVLLIHKMIIKHKLWDAQEDFEYGDAVLKATKFDLIVAGDNHNHFAYAHSMRHLVNCGSLMRLSAAQLEHKPCFYVWDSRERKVTYHEIPVSPSETVFDMENLEIIKERDEKLEAFVNGLDSDVEVTRDFKANLDEFIKKNDVPAAAVRVIQNALGD